MSESKKPESKKPIFTTYKDSKTGEISVAEVILKDEYERRMREKPLDQLPISEDNLNPPKPNSN
ncbi:MAG: hypothetical protein A2383_01365 [Candidatus Pacebacteria bacterium RIFOXYB1_FULL_39_46]|nr:MAG: hypothetical protein A2383_01365 [Candidatus Pacebacteria bacterium RIFOXYB1_FULL_39_46]OGJ39040.1 MAG: hypothetical protein A2182_01785 [Candidatus Pacebacteria bacterium RIFOXYA1_FULL_38_18]OGJ40011.1 MAG: hypothetical protein A2582_01310 [Candidatus Pacebacteria bacterium RIFOXYD1_FULL_39_27]OGJ40727.1 MAG: hypothetical protein A2411_00385 [Candidatus Pacebacteria bacterium RIFOXYC1_FULL_39_21]